MAKVEWPSWRYGPNGAAKIFNEGDKIPAGWQDHPSKVKEGKSGKTAPKKSAAETDETQAAEDAKYRAEAIKFLKELGTEVDPNISDEELDKLVDSAGE